MKLLPKPLVASKIQAENNALVESNIRLRKYEGDVLHRLNTIKDEYGPDKLAKLKEFEQFCKDLQIKRSKLLGELQAIEKLVEEKKDLYYGLITKGDALTEKEYQINESNKKLDLREAFITDLEEKWRNKQ